jgi:hypothetical protein
MNDAPRCDWCGRPFQARQSGGHPQRFCRPACRRAYEAAGRRWMAEAVVAGVLTVDMLRSGVGATRASAHRPAAVERRTENGRTAQDTLEQAMQRAIAARRR